MGTIIVPKKADTTKTTCIEISAESYKCIDISSYVPTCIMITNYTPTPFTIPTPNISALSEASPFEKVTVTINNFNAEYSYTITTSLNGGSIDLLADGSFEWTMPDYQDPSFYDNIHSVTVIAELDGEQSLAATHSIEVQFPGEINMTFINRDYLKADGIYTEIEISAYIYGTDSLTISIYTTSGDPLLYEPYREKIIAYDKNDNIIGSVTYHEITVNPNDVKYLKIAHSLYLGYDSVPDGDWDIVASWGSPAKHSNIKVGHEKLLDQKALTPTLATSISSGETQTYDMTNHIETLDYSALNYSAAVTASIVGNILTITATSDPIYESQSARIDLLLTSPINDNRLYQNAFDINYVKTI